MARQYGEIKIINKPLDDVIIEFRVTIEKSNSLLLIKIDKTGFYLKSKKNYGSLSMVEKDYYRIKGKFKELNKEQTELSYQVIVNSTYKTISIVLPLFLIPTLFLSSMGGGKSGLINSVVIFIILIGIVFYWAYRYENKLQNSGKKSIELVLNNVKNKT